MLTVEVLLLLGGHHRQEVAPTQAAVLLGCLPAPPAAEEAITEALEPVPAGVAHLQVWEPAGQDGGWVEVGGWGWG